jgi:hypothetical protein
MENWIPLSEGEYDADQALLLAPDSTAVLLDRAYIQVFSGSQGRLHLTGYGQIENVLLIQLLDDHDDIDLLLDFGEGFRFLLKEPELSAGKVFSPDVKSTLQFYPIKPWERLSEEEFRALCSNIVYI